MNKKIGRPKKYNGEEVEKIKEDLKKYIETNDVPILAEFAYKNKVPRITLYDYPEFSTLIKRMMDKKEAQLEKGGLAGVVNSTMAIFSLKQLGWRDRPKDEKPNDDATALYKAIAEKLLGP